MLNDTTQGMGCQELGNCVLSGMAPLLWHPGVLDMAFSVGASVIFGRSPR